MSGSPVLWNVNVFQDASLHPESARTLMETGEYQYL
jgi:hypothetical protein